MHACLLYPCVHLHVLTLLTKMWIQNLVFASLHKNLIFGKKAPLFLFFSFAFKNYTNPPVAFFVAGTPYLTYHLFGL